MTKDNKYNLLKAVTEFLKDRFNLESDKADEYETIEYIKKGVDFKGTNLWILIFAIFIASIGLNVNSTAVIIGAMLISPLMGPILGIGLGVGINDPDLIKRALKNLSIAAGISVITSTIYFSVSPLSDAQSELLARTTPTIWDVLIAFFGGLAGIVAGSRKEKSNAIPGVAIATALMPPLCTAGYGIASGNMYYFLGAFYLFFINSVFISLATFLIVRFLGYPKKHFVDEKMEHKVKLAISFFAFITLVPSIYLGYNVVSRSIFERNAMNFINHELKFDNCHIVSKTFDFDTNPMRIEVSLFGESLSEDVVKLVRNQLTNYNLDGAELVLFQGYDANMSNMMLESSLRSNIIDELYKQNQELIQTKDEKIRVLENELIQMKQMAYLSTDVAAELSSLYPTVKEFSMSRSLLTQMNPARQDTVYLAFLKFTKQPSTQELTKIENWLKARTKSKAIKVIVQG